MTTENPQLYEEDGLIMPEVGQWATTKHRKVGYYARLFSRGMKRKWDRRVYMDLFAGAGKCRISETKDVIPGSPLLALNVDDPFDKYIFCEQDDAHFAALDQRVRRYFPERSVSLIPGDSNSVVEQILAAVPKFSSGLTGLTFCFVDPYSMGELKFDTVAKIAGRLLVDFLVLIPSYMDINRNEHIYTQDNCSTLDDYLGTAAWRSAWRDPRRKFRDFGVFAADFLCQRMAGLDYIYEGPEDLELVRTEDRKNLPLYHLAFFSRNELGLRFWRDTRKRTDDQESLW